MNTNTYQKGDIYFYWGWNRGFYTNSDIHFKGEHYDFQLDNVVAKDRQTPFEVNPYLNPRNLTIPQTNFRIGYFINDHYNVSFGFDHMKYVVQTNQTVKITGEIDDTGMIYDGRYENDDIVISPDFLQFEHTDGLNYINLSFRRVDKILAFNKVKLHVTGGVDVGVLVPRTDAELLNFGENDKYHLSGFGGSLVAGLNLTFFDHFFVQSELKGGYINMPDMRTTSSKMDKASQSFFFDQYNIVFGWVFHIERPTPVPVMSN
ncbi:hypothetical protein G3O08_01740 [Cryomorpha ignava]|uniref:Outer membrane protein beta-barrel domain-containing protein n=1 Tax=Cryomorpha ignava TaxID=101383 RepID=A0A7K3WNE6_9FLAO|nr:hypothetical protein [Cryomorpha ignava]